MGDPTEIQVLDNLTCLCNDSKGRFMGQSHQVHLTAQMVLRLYAKVRLSMAVDNTAYPNLTMNIGNIKLLLTIV